jgi:hypothetical protein
VYLVAGELVDIFVGLVFVRLLQFGFQASFIYMLLNMVEYVCIIGSPSRIASCVCYKQQQIVHLSYAVDVVGWSLRCCKKLVFVKGASRIAVKGG